MTPLATRAGAQLANQATPKAQLHIGAHGGSNLLGGATPLLPPQPSATSACSESQVTEGEALGMGEAMPGICSWPW